MPIGDIAPLGVEGTFVSSFKEELSNDGSPIAAMIFGSIVLASVRSKGYKDHKDISKVIMMAGMIASFRISHHLWWFNVFRCPNFRS